MKTEFKIQVPEGMEIDRKNSTFECIKFKPKELTYIEISKKFPKNPSVSVNARHFSKLLTIRQLLEVADYLNGDWKPDWNDMNQSKYIISYNIQYKTFFIQNCWYVNDGSMVCFSSIENAEKAINIIGEKNLLNFYLNK